MHKNRPVSASRVIGALALLIAATLVFRFSGFGASDEREFRPPVDWVVARPDIRSTLPARAAPAPTASGVSVAVAKTPADEPPADPLDKMSSDLVAALDSSLPDSRFRVIVQPRRDSAHRIDDIRSIRDHSSSAGMSTLFHIDFIGATVLDLDREELLSLTSRHEVGRVSLDARVEVTDCDRSTEALGANQVWLGTPELNGAKGSGVTVAVIDSGVDATHTDFRRGRGKTRVTEQTFVRNFGDDFGHGTHVAGIIAGEGRHLAKFVEMEDNPAIGIAPKADILSLRVLDSEGRGFASDVIAAIAYATLFKEYYGIRVINLSLGHPVTQPYEFDPMALACRLAVEAGIAVVCSAGNAGSNDGESVFGGVSSPGNAPWVITVGATNGACTAARSDDTIAGFSSRGPTAIDGLLKPDLVAPGVGIVSCQPLGPDFINDNYDVKYMLRDGSGDHYMVLNGTSMAAPMVAGTLALMFEVNPGLSPNVAKAILLYTTEKMLDPSVLEQGSGLLNTEAAVRMSRAIKSDQKLLDFGEFQLAATDPDDARGMLLPVTYIGNEKVYWGASFLYGRHAVWGRGSIMGDNLLWGNGLVWSDTILWTHGEPWYDELMATKGPVYGNTILWTHAGVGGLVWSDTILWTYGALPGFDPDNYVISDTILWTYSEIFSQWSGSMIDPTSVEDEGQGVLIEGEDYHGSGATFLAEDSPFYPKE